MTTNNAVDRETAAPPPPSTPATAENREAECQHHLTGKHGKKHGKKDGKAKKSKKDKKGKLSPYEECLLGKGKKGKKKKHGAMLAKNSKAHHTGFVAVTCIIFFIVGAAVIIVTKNTHNEERWLQYDAIDMKLNEPGLERGPVAPIPLRAFGTFPNASMTAAELDAAVADMRIPPPRSPMVHDARSPIVYDARSPLRPSRGSGRRQLPPLHMTMETDLDALAETPLVL